MAVFGGTLLLADRCIRRHSFPFKSALNVMALAIAFSLILLGENVASASDEVASKIRFRSLGELKEATGVLRQMCLPGVSPFLGKNSDFIPAEEAFARTCQVTHGVLNREMDKLHQLYRSAHTRFVEAAPTALASAETEAEYFTLSRKQAQFLVDFNRRAHAQLGELSKIIEKRMQYHSNLAKTLSNINGERQVKSKHISIARGLDLLTCSPTGRICPNDPSATGAVIVDLNYYEELVRTTSDQALATHALEHRHVELAESGAPLELRADEAVFISAARSRANEDTEVPMLTGVIPRSQQMIIGDDEVDTKIVDDYLGDTTEALSAPFYREGARTVEHVPHNGFRIGGALFSGRNIIQANRETSAPDSIDGWKLSGGTLFTNNYIGEAISYNEDGTMATFQNIDYVSTDTWVRAEKGITPNLSVSMESGLYSIGPKAPFGIASDSLKEEVHCAVGNCDPFGEIEANGFDGFQNYSVDQNGNVATGGPGTELKSLRLGATYYPDQLRYRSDNGKFNMTTNMSAQLQLPVNPDFDPNATIALGSTTTATYDAGQYRFSGSKTVSVDQRIFAVGDAYQPYDSKVNGALELSLGAQRFDSDGSGSTYFNAGYTLMTQNRFDRTKDFSSNTALTQDSQTGAHEFFSVALGRTWKTKKKNNCYAQLGFSEDIGILSQHDYFNSSGLVSIVDNGNAASDYQLSAQGGCTW